MKTSIGTLAVIATFAAFAWYLLAGPPRPQAQQPSGGHAGHAGDPTALADGVVVAVNRVARNVTISHGPLQNLGMPPMTMGFQVADPAQLRDLKAGDKVKFHADAIGGALVVMKVELVK